jgi:hypothetical protein
LKKGKENFGNYKIIIILLGKERVEKIIINS